MNRSRSFENIVSSLDNSDLSKDSRRPSVFSLIPDVAKRMSRSFVESVIAVDQIWDDTDVCNSTRRYSRHYNKGRQSPHISSTKPMHRLQKPNSRRHSLPNTSHNKLKPQGIGNKPPFHVNVYSNPIQQADDKEGSPEPIASPLSVLEGNDSDYTYPTPKELASNRQISSNSNISQPSPLIRSSPIPNMETRDSGLPLSTTGQMAKLRSESITSTISQSPGSAASPKIYSRRNGSSLTATPYANYTYDGIDSASTTSTERTTPPISISGNGNNKKKLFNYQAKLRLADRPSESRSITMEKMLTLTPHCSDGTAYTDPAPQFAPDVKIASKSAELSQLSDVPSIPKKPSPKLQPVPSPKHSKNLSLPPISVELGAKMDTIQEESKDSKADAPELSDVRPITPVQRVSVKHINNIYHGNNSSISGVSKMAEMEQILSEIEEGSELRTSSPSNTAHRKVSEYSAVAKKVLVGDNQNDMEDVDDDEEDDDDDDKMPSPQLGPIMGNRNTSVTMSYKVDLEEMDDVLENIDEFAK